MPSRVQTLRSNVAGNRPPPGQLPGSLYVNWPDAQIGVVNASSNNMDLLGVRLFSAQANYVVGDFVVQGGQLYRSKIAQPPGSFNTANWDQVQNASDAAGYLPLAGGTLTGPLTLAANPTAALGAATKQYIDNGYLAKTGGTLSGPLTISTGAAPSFVSLSANSGQLRQIASYSGVPSSSTSRWAMVLGDNSSESGSNAGSDFAFQSYNDAGAYLATPLSITRSTSAVGMPGAVTVGNLTTAGNIIGNVYYGPSGGAANLALTGGYFNGSWSGAASSIYYRINGAQPGKPWLVSSASACSIDFGTGTGGPSNSAGYLYGSSTQLMGWWYCDGASDERLKENIKPSSIDALAALNEIPIEEFDWKADVVEHFAYDDAHVPIGMVAQKVQDIIYSGVASNKHEASGALPANVLSLNDSAFTPYMIRAIQQLTARIEELEAQLAAR